MPRKDMSSPAKRRPPPGGTGPKGASGSISGARSPPRPSRTVATSNTTTAPGSSNTYIAPPPRAALSGTSSPTPDNPRNNTTSRDPIGAVPSPRLGGLVTRPSTTTSRSPSPATNQIGQIGSGVSGAGAGARVEGPTQIATATSSSASPASTTPLATALQGALREKDLRIASLESELALMESEFHRELDKLSSAESETAAYWQGKCAALEKQVATVILSLQHQPPFPPSRPHQQGVVGVGDGEGGGEREREREREEELREARAAWARTRDVLEQREQELREVRAQVRGLKEWVSVSTRAHGEAQTSDEVFGEGMARLGNRLQNWVLVNFRRARVGEYCSGPGAGLRLSGGLTVADLSGADEDAISELARLVPMYEDLASASRIHLLQSLVSRVLVELVFNAYFVGLPADVAAQIKQVEVFLSSLASPESINQWRSLTLTIVKRDAGEKLQTGTAAIVDMVVSKVSSLLDAITNTKSSESRDQGLQALVTSAIELSRLLAVQKAVFKVEMPEILPHQRTMFDPEIMEDIGGEDEDSLADREICCVTFPGIIKRGDESGGHLQYRNVISKVKVLCSPE
ncbi:hypothetical protein N657DRAFT_574646 [Parathielavia appendiculata]|uniref:Uncharacterized protein n=1 Tax=Parathielavia appendiculata TaxID=2587402 RepID=A0AAN6TY56_9PEZI|nr:hypothetical protein N657DRAFT_574646 [Parathielavia appendiculata]